MAKKKKIVEPTELIEAKKTVEKKKVKSTVKPKETTIKDKEASKETTIKDKEASKETTIKDKEASKETTIKDKEASKETTIKDKEASNVEKFQMLVDCANKERGLFWSRSSFFIAVHSALFAFTPKLIGNLTNGISFSNILILGVPLIGFILAAVWWQIVKESGSMITHWENKLQSLQNSTFKDFYCKKDSCMNIRCIIYCMTIVFALIWFSIFAAIYIKINGCPMSFCSLI